MTSYLTVTVLGVMLRGMNPYPDVIACEEAWRTMGPVWESSVLNGGKAVHLCVEEGEPCGKGHKNKCKGGEWQ